MGIQATFVHINMIKAKLGQENLLRIVRWHCIPDTQFEIRALGVWGRARYLLVTEAPHDIESIRNILFLWNLEARVGFEPAISDFASRQLFPLDNQIIIAFAKDNFKAAPWDDKMKMNRALGHLCAHIG